MWTDGRTDGRTDIPTDGQTFPPLMLLGRLGGVSLTRGVDRYSNFGPIKGYVAETVHDRR